MVQANRQAQRLRHAPAARHQRADQRMVGVVTRLFDFGEAQALVLVAFLQRVTVFGKALHQQRDANVAEQAEALRQIGRHAARSARQPAHGVRALGRNVPEAKQHRALGVDHAAQDQAGDDHANLLQAQHVDCLLQRLTGARQAVKRRVDDAQHRDAQRHVGADQAGDGPKVRVFLGHFALQRDQGRGSRWNADVLDQGIGFLGCQLNFSLLRGFRYAHVQDFRGERA